MRFVLLLSLSFIFNNVNGQIIGPGKMVLLPGPVDTSGSKLIFDRLTHSEGYRYIPTINDRERDTVRALILLIDTSTTKHNATRFVSMQNTDKVRWLFRY